MKYTELKNRIKESIESIYLLEGDDGYFRDGGEQLIKSLCVQIPELDYCSFDGSLLKGAAINEFVSAIAAYPFGSLKRVVKVSEFYPSEDEYEKYLKKTFENMPQSTVVIIVNSQTKKGMDLKRRRCVTYVDCNRADEETVAKWVYITLRRSGVNCSSEAAATVARYCLCDMSRVNLETQKLLLSGLKEISVADVDELVYMDADYRVYEMTNAIFRKNYTAFCTILTELKSKGMDNIAIISSLLSYFRNLLTVLISDDSDSNLAAALKKKEYGVKKDREAARLIGESALKSHISCLYGLISRTKSGLLTSDSALYMAMNEIFFKSA